MKSIKTHSSSIQSSSVFLISAELSDRVKPDEIKSQLLGLDNKQNDLGIRIKNNEYVVIDLNIANGTVVLVGDIYILCELLDKPTRTADLVIQGKIVKSHIIKFDNIKNLNNGKFNYTFKILS